MDRFDYGFRFLASGALKRLSFGMTFEQPASFNRLVAKPLPRTWGMRWKLIQIYLPILAFITICMAERIGFEMCAHDRFVPGLLLLALLPSSFLLAIASISIEIRLRSQGGNRVLNVLEKGISFQGVSRPSVRWSRVVAFWFEEIPSEPQLSKITVEYCGDRKTKFPRRWSLVLERRGQCQALLSELNLLQQQHALKFRIELDRPLPVRPPPQNAVLGLSLGLAGMWFLLHGVPLLLVSLQQHKGEPHHSDSINRSAKFVVEHFSSAAEFHRFMMETGAILTSIGIGLMVWGILVQRQKPGMQTSECGGELARPLASEKG